MLTNLKKVLGFDNPRVGNKIIINCESLERRVAVLEDGSLEEYTIERTQEKNIVGSIFKGVVKNIEPGLKAMFVDIGLEKNAFLHFWDAIPAALDSGMEEIKRGRGRSSSRKKRITAKDIPHIYPVGSEVMVQVTKGAIGTKGPRVTTNISLAGRYLVMMPLHEQFGISRKIDDPKERKRIRKIMEKMTIPEGVGVIMRTVAQGKRARYFVRDLGILFDQWEMIDKKAKTKKAPLCVFREPGLVERTVRDFLTDEVEAVICDDEAVTEEMRTLVSSISRRAKKSLHYYSGTEPIFEKFGIQRQIDNASRRQVWLECGGYIVIDETEALVAIDVNTGRNKGPSNVEKTIVQTNVEAVEEVARQLRLRNIGGLVVIDLIDMKSGRDRQLVYRALLEGLRKDKAKTQVLPISQLGLMEMTRQRLNESISDAAYETCPYCSGKGKVKTTETMSVELQRKLNAVVNRKDKKYGDLIIIVNPEVMHRLRTEDDKLLVELERQHQGQFIFRSDPTFHREKVTLIDAATEKTIEV